MAHPTGRTFSEQSSYLQSVSLFCRHFSLTHYYFLCRYKLSLQLLSLSHSAIRSRKNHIIVAQFTVVSIEDSCIAITYLS